MRKSSLMDLSSEINSKAQLEISIEQKFIQITSDELIRENQYHQDLSDFIELVREYLKKNYDKIFIEKLFNKQYRLNATTSLVGQRYLFSNSPNFVRYVLFGKTNVTLLTNMTELLITICDKITSVSLLETIHDQIKIVFIIFYDQCINGVFKDPICHQWKKNLFMVNKILETWTKIFPYCLLIDSRSKYHILDDPPVTFNQCLVQFLYLSLRCTYPDNFEHGYPKGSILYDHEVDQLQNFLETTIVRKTVDSFLDGLVCMFRKIKPNSYAVCLLTDDPNSLSIMNEYQETYGCLSIFMDNMFQRSSLAKWKNSICGEVLDLAKQKAKE